jgi:phenylalanyl-tRNA synthetase beta chain
VKISVRWLARHVDLEGLTAHEIAEGLTLSTAEVEAVERFLPHLSDVVVGSVVERAKHPDADKLSVCRVDVGAGELLGIVCGASNVAAGQKVAVARVGTRLPGDLVIKKAKIRGAESQGMICSERELGLGDEHSGIWVLPEDAPVGRPVAESLGMVDWTIEIDNKSLTHRPDLWGHRGMAGEVAAIFRRALRPIDTSLPPTGSGEPFPVRIETPACSRYVALGIENARARRSPPWLKELLLAVGQRPIDLLVGGGAPGRRRSPRPTGAAGRPRSPADRAWSPAAAPAVPPPRAAPPAKASRRSAGRRRPGSLSPSPAAPRPPARSPRGGSSGPGTDRCGRSGRSAPNGASHRSA